MASKQIKFKNPTLKKYSENRYELIINLDDLQIVKLVDITINNKTDEYFFELLYVNGSKKYIHIDTEFISLKKSNKRNYDLLKLEWDIKFSHINKNPDLKYITHETN